MHESQRSKSRVSSLRQLLPNLKAGGSSRLQCHPNIGTKRRDQGVPTECERTTLSASSKGLLEGDVARDACDRRPWRSGVCVSLSSRTPVFWSGRAGREAEDSCRLQEFYRERLC